MEGVYPDKLCGALQTHFHKRGRSGKRQLQRRFLRKRGAVGRSAFSVGQNAIACYLWALSTRNPFRENPPVFLHCKLQWFYAEHTQHNTGAHPIAALQNKKAIVFAFLHQRWLRIGAADEARTRYLHLGKVALYQMSYGRILETRLGLLFVVPPIGIEPMTRGFSVPCSTD